MTVRLERPIHYGNAGLAFDESRPSDDAYLFKPDNTRDVWSHIRTITERYGYDFAPDEDGDFQIGTRNNPHTVVDIAAADITGQVAATANDVTAPNAYAGEYVETTGDVPQFSFAVNAARIDLVLPVGPGLGSWTVEVKQGATTVAGPAVIDPDNSGGANEDLQYYDARAAVDGTNATVVTLFSGFYDAYTVYFTGSGAGTRRLDSLMTWHTDPQNPLYPFALSTGQNALQASAKSTMDELRNYVIVVGRRRAVVTDSSKVIANPENPVDEFYVASGVDVGSVADPTAGNYLGFLKQSLIYDSSVSDQDFADYLARTFIYRQRQPAPDATVTHTLLPAVELRDPIYVVDDEFDTLDSAVVQHVVGVAHNVTGTSATTTIQSTSYPEFPSYEVREDIDIDAKFNGSPVANVEISYTSLTGDDITNIGAGEVHESGTEDLITAASKSVTGSAPNQVIDMSGEDWPPLPGCVYLTPSNESLGVSATVLTSSAISHPIGYDFTPIDVPGIVGPPTLVEVGVLYGLGSYNWIPITTNPLDSSHYYYQFDSQSGGGKVRIYDQRPVPPHLGHNLQTQTVKTRVTYDKGDSSLGSAYQTNTPYTHLLEVDYSDGNREIALPWKQGDGTVKYRNASTAYHVTYRRLGPVDGGAAFDDPYSGVSPFYDPYTSEVGNFVSIKFDALISGRYRISIRSTGPDDTVVAWLTEPTLAAAEEEAHWQYMTAGVGRTFLWDGVDQRGDWNRRQSEGYASAAQGAFEQSQKPLVGAGFYAWNVEEAQNGYPRIALISGDRDGNGKPIFGQGTYSEWYVKIEATNDRLEEIADAAQASSGTVRQMSAIRVVDSRKMNEVDGLPGNDYEARIYMHLPEPTKVELTVHDWLGGVDTDYDPTDETALNTAGNWTTGDAARSYNSDGIINNQRPVRVRFTPVSRPGVLWSGNDALLSFKLSRVAHLRVNLADQFVIFAGTNYAGQNVENRRVVSRRLTNDDHTLRFEDSGWRQTPSLKQSDGGTGMEWIFSPRDFRKDFRGIANEPLQFGDYLQLEEVPGWTSDKAVAGARSRFQIAFMSYLFYLSAYSQDRSGRYTWCLNREFLDKSKIVQNVRGDWTDSNKPTEWPDDMTTQFRRSMIVRQWTDERESETSTTPWRTAQANKWFAGDTSTNSAGYALLRHYWKEHELDGTFETSDGTGLPIGGTNWYRLKTFGTVANVAIDSYSNYMRDVAGQLPATWDHQLYRQLGTAAETVLGLWTWETGPVWVPSVSRDFQGYYYLPPMADYLYRNDDLVDDRCYDTVDYRHYVDDNADSNRNTGGDCAAGPVWNSPVLDMTSPYVGSTVTVAGVRFFPGRVVTPDKTPTKNIASNCIDYERQDDLVHYEDLRGLYSRGPRPTEQPKKVNSGNPYYQNLYTYEGFGPRTARKQEKLLPLYRANVAAWFSFTFRSEYVWESSHFFPTDQYGKFRTDAMNVARTRHLTANTIRNIRYDAGAWVGWKDDNTVTGTLVAGETAVYVGQALYDPSVSSPSRNILAGAYMPVSNGPKLTVTRDVIMHLVLVDERREASVL